MADFRVDPYPGLFKRRITVMTDDPEHAQTELTIIGWVAETLAWTPARFEIAAYKEDITCPEITIKSLDSVAFSIRGFTATGQCLTAELDPNHKSAEFTLKPTVDVAKLNGLVGANGNVRIELDHPDYKMIDVPFSVIPALQATPPQVLVFNALADQSVVRILQLQDNQADPNTGAALQVESVMCKNGSRAQLCGVTGAKTGCQIKLEIWPGAAKDSESFSTDELTIRMKDGRQMIVPLRVFYQVPALSAASPGS
jgi:hypothetical protein